MPQVLSERTAGTKLPKPADSQPSPGVLGKTTWMHALHRDWAGSVYHFPKPTVALVNGACAGGGFGLSLAADFRIASEDAFFVSAFATIALVGDNGVTYGLQRLLGRSKALEILVLSPRIGAAEALDLGLVRQVVPHERLMVAGLEFCERLAAAPPTVLALMKANMAFVETANYQERLDRESIGIAIAGTTTDSAEAIAAFLAKRRREFQ